MAKSHIWAAETPTPIATKFCIPGADQNVITHANFGEDRLRGFGVARGRILTFSIDLLRCLYNTLALPCECVIKTNDVVLETKVLVSSRLKEKK